MGLLKLAAFRREHQLDQLLGDLRLEPCGVSLFEAHDISGSLVPGIAKATSQPSRKNE